MADGECDEIIVEYAGVKYRLLERLDFPPKTKEYWMLERIDE